MKILEKDIEQYLFDNPNAARYSLVRSCYCPVYNEVNFWLARQFHVASGIIDLLGMTRGEDFAVVEIKRGEIKPDALAQVSRYANDFKNMISHCQTAFMNEMCKQGLADVVGDMDDLVIHKVIVGRSISAKTLIEARSLDIHCSTIDIENETVCTPAFIDFNILDRLIDTEIGITKSIEANVISLLCRKYSIETHNGNGLDVMDQVENILSGIDY